MEILPHLRTIRDAAERPANENTVSAIADSDPIFQTIAQWRVSWRETEKAAVALRRAEASYGAGSARAEAADKHWDILIQQQAERLGVVCRMAPTTPAGLLAFVDVMREHVWEAEPDTWCDGDAVAASYESLRASLDRLK